MGYKPIPIAKCKAPQGEETIRLTHRLCVSFHCSLSAKNSNNRGAEPLYQNCRVTVCSSSSSEEDSSIRKPPQRTERRWRRQREAVHTAQGTVESQYETGYTTGDTGNELEREQTDYLYRWAHRTFLPVYPPSSTFRTCDGIQPAVMATRRPLHPVDDRNWSSGLLMLLCRS